MAIEVPVPPVPEVARAARAEERTPVLTIFAPAGGDPSLTIGRERGEYDAEGNVIRTTAVDGERLTRTQILDLGLPADVLKKIATVEKLIPEVCDAIVIAARAKRERDAAETDRHLQEEEAKRREEETRRQTEQEAEAARMRKNTEALDRDRLAREQAAIEAAASEEVEL